MATSFRVNSPNVIHETIDGEVIIIDLGTGTYYSLRGVGAAIWHALEQGAREAEIGASLEERYEGSSGEIREAARRLVAELEHEHLISAVDLDHGQGVRAMTAEQHGAARLPFEPPTLEKHTDMQDLILLDPVHQVGAEGWPHAKESGGAGS
jgi:Coenzyme PQQ synthesis protein D (PqqD)